MSLEQLPKLQALIAQGWDLTVTARYYGKFHATVHLGRLHGPDSHHWIGHSLAEAIAGLERYVGERDASASIPIAPPDMIGKYPVSSRADKWTPEQIAEFYDHTVQCRCGWWGKVSALKALPNITRSDSTAAGSPGLGHWESLAMASSLKRGCPECGAEFTPAINMLAPHLQDKPL